MLALVAALSTVGANINSNAGAANANNAGSLLSEKIFTGVGGFALGGLAVALLTKFTGLGSKLVGTGSLKADKAVLVKYFKYLIENGANGFAFTVNNGSVDIQISCEGENEDDWGYLGNMNVNEDGAKALEGNNELNEEALYTAQKKWSSVISNSCMAGLIEARGLADLKHPSNNHKYRVNVAIDDGDILCVVNGVKVNKSSDAMDTEAKELNDFVKKVEDEVKKLTIVQAFKEAMLEHKKATSKGKK